MRIHPVSSVNKARRRIIVAAALITLLLLPALVSAQQKRRGRAPAARRAARERLIEKDFFSDHRPPISFEDGSLVLGAPSPSQMQSPVTNTDPNRPRHVYRRTNAIRRSVGVSLVTENDDGTFSPHGAPLPTGANWELWIWLEQRKAKGPGYEPVPTPSPQTGMPQLIVSRSAPGGILTIEIDTPLFTEDNCKPTDVVERPCKYTHPGYGTGRKFRIGRIDIVRGNGGRENIPLDPNRAAIRGNVVQEPHRRTRNLRRR